jgi:hypothetical protein
VTFQVVLKVVAVLSPMIARPFDPIHLSRGEAVVQDSRRLLRALIGTGLEACQSLVMYRRSVLRFLGELVVLRLD